LKPGHTREVTLTYAPLVDLYTDIALVAQAQLGQLGIRINAETQSARAAA
jgi:hypothetical protein